MHLTSYGTLTVLFDEPDAPRLLNPIDSTEIAEDTSARFVVIQKGMGGNCANNEQLRIVVEGNLERPEGTVTTPDGKSICFTPAKNFFHADDESYVTIAYHLEDELNPERKPSPSGELRVHVYAQNDKVKFKNFNYKYITVTEDAPSPLEVKFDVVDLDRGYVRTDDGKTIAQPVTFSVDWVEADGQGKLTRFGDIVLDTPENVGPDGIHTITLTFKQIKDAFHPSDDKVTNVNVRAIHAGDQFSASRDFRVYVSSDNDAPYHTTDEAHTDSGIKSGNLVLDETCEEDDPGFTINLLNRFWDLDDGRGKLRITALSPDASAPSGTTATAPLPSTPTKDFCTYKDIDSLHAWFDFTISDPYNAAYSGKLKIFVIPVNDKPVARDYTKTVLEDTSSKKSITRSCT